jgi:hypothetical protein
MSVAAGASSKHVEAASVNHIDLESNVDASTACETESSQAPVNRNDTSTTVETESSQAPAKTDGTAKRRQRNRKIVGLCAGCFCALAVAIVVFVMLFCVRDPTWEVVDTRIDSGSIRTLMMAVAAPSNSTPVINMTSTVRIYNPNVVGAFIEPDAAHVTFHNEEVATSWLEPFALRRRSTTTLTADVSVIISPSLAPFVVQAVIGNTGMIEVHAVADATAHIGILQLRTRIECKIWADMLATIGPGPHPDGGIHYTECTYYKSL